MFIIIFCRFCTFIYTFTSLSINISQPKKRRSRKFDFKNPIHISESNCTTFVKNNNNEISIK